MGGGNLAFATREQMTYTMECLKVGGAAQLEQGFAGQMQHRRLTAALQAHKMLQSRGPAEERRCDWGPSLSPNQPHMRTCAPCLQTSVPVALELLCDAVLNPEFSEQEVSEACGTATAKLGAPPAAM